MNQVRYVALTLFFVPPLLLLTALDLSPSNSNFTRLENVPFEFNRARFSGEACLSMCLRSMGARRF